MVHRCEHLCSASQLWLPHPALCVVPPECFRGLCVWSGAVGSKSGKLRNVADHDTLKEMNDREARKNQVIHNSQGQNMHKLQDQWQELMGYARNLGLYCFATMVTSDPGNASAFSQNVVIYNDEIVGSFLKANLDLPNLKGHFYRHVLLATDQPDAVLAYRGEEKKLKGKVECQNWDRI